MRALIEKNTNDWEAAFPAIDERLYAAADAWKNAPYYEFLSAGPEFASAWFGQAKIYEAARKDRGWTSERLSEACNINATYLRQIESGAKTPSLQVFVTLCSTLNVSPTYLLADNLNLTESQDLDSLLALCRSATPKQINMIVAMVRSALESVE